MHADCRVMGSCCFVKHVVNIVDEQKPQMSFMFVLKTAMNSSDSWRMNARRWFSMH